MQGKILPPHFYQGEDVVQIARLLLGKVLVTNLNGKQTAGMIVETEAYHGEDDRASHAYLRRRTARTETMFLPGGHAYVYLCYGIHQLFNIVTHRENEPDAVLIRAVEPISGLETILDRRKMNVIHPRLCKGPGCVAQALGIGKSLNGCDLTKREHVWVEDRNIRIPEEDIVATTRIGVEYAKEDAMRKWRFLVRGNKWVSAPPRLEI